MWEEKLAQYDELVSKCPRFERKGKTVPYTSANGYMFSILNKDAELGIRFSSAEQKKYMQELDTTFFMSHGAKMKGYILVTESMWDEPDAIVNYLNESYDYVMTLEPK
jgi:hypothetical protein